MLQGIIQYSYDARELRTQRGKAWTNENLCKMMINPARSPLQRLSDVYELAHPDDTKFDPSYANLIKPWQNTTIEGSDGYRCVLPTDKLRPTDLFSNISASYCSLSVRTKSLFRGWLWLSCNEFGWLQSTTGSVMFGDAVPIKCISYPNALLKLNFSFLYKICGDLFDNVFNASIMEGKVRQTLLTYGYPWSYNVGSVVL